MSNILTALDGIGFPTLIWVFYLAVVVHELEEWNIDRFERRNFTGLPPAATDASARMVIAFVHLLGLVWACAATWSGDASTAAWVFLPAVGILFANAIQHVYWSFRFREYAPGVVTGATLLIPLGGTMLAGSVTQGLVPVWYAALLVLLILLGVTQTVIAGDRMTPIVRGANLIGIRLLEWVKSFRRPSIA